MYGKKLFIKKYCYDVDENISMDTALSTDWNGKKRYFSSPNLLFYVSIMKQFSNLLLDSEAYFNKKKIEKLNQSNEKKQNSSVNRSYIRMWGQIFFAQ